MDSLEAMYFVDDFLNFSLDIEDQNPKEEEEEEQNQKHQDNDEETYQKHPQNPCFDSKSKTHLNTLERDEDSSPVLEDEGEEEELEWLKDEFPPFEPFVVGSFQTPKHQSPVSVLESGFRVPVRARSRIQRRKRVGDSGLVGMWGGDGRRDGVAVVEARRRCRHCLAEKTPQWRAGPLGPKTLCNACGVRYKAGRLVPEYRPASSPSFSSELHSNSHRKILEIRRKKHKGVEKG